MSSENRITTIDAICLHLRKFADTIEKLIASRSGSVPQNIDDLSATVADARKQLHELGALAESAGLDDQRATTILNLGVRYQALEGALKEIRNDRDQVRADFRDATHPLPSPSRRPLP